jgi:hypothetical protein
MYGEVYGLQQVSSPVREGSKGTTDANTLSSPTVAQPFELVLNEHYLEAPERSLCGIVDRVVRSKQDGARYVMDLKTTGLYLSGAWFEQWRHSLQAAIYLDLVEREFQNVHPQLIMQHGHIAGPVPDSFKGKVQVAGFWVDAIHLDRRGYPKREDFMRVGPFPYSQALREELREVVDGLVQTAKLIDMNPHTQMASKNPKSCFRFNALCPFFQFCTLDPQDRADAVRMGLASGDFVASEWKPEERK